MSPITKQQIKSIYTLGVSLGMVERANHDDALHQLVKGIASKESVKALDCDEAKAVITELMKRMRGCRFYPARKSARKYSETPGGVTAGQQRKVWQLMYKLRKCDRRPTSASLGERLCGIIKRQFNMDAAAENPFRFLSCGDGNKLIEILKKYCYNAECRGSDAG